MSLSVARRIADIARAAPDQAAIVGFDTTLAEQTLSWKEVADLVEDTAGALRATLDRNSRPCVVVEAGNTLPSATGIAAVLAAEFPVLPLNPATSPTERETLLRLLSRRFGQVCLLDRDHTPQLLDLPRETHRDDRPAAYLLATGGSSGVPKISVRAGPLRYDAGRTPSLVVKQAGWRTGQRQLIVGPLYHAAPFTSFLDALLDRNTVVLQPFFAPSWTVDLVRQHAVQWMQLTPAHMREILPLARQEPAGFDSLRAVLHTAAHCDANTKRGWIDLLGPARLYELYGTTEGIGVTLVRGDE
jgi:bile acid-coenzyme A ligase